MNQGVIVIGEAVVDVVRTRSHGQRTRMVLGGSPYNVAIGLARLKVPAVFVGSIAQDSLGRRLYGYLESTGVDTSGVIRRRGGRTFLALVALDEGRPSFSFQGNLSDVLLEASAELPVDLIGETSVVHIGSTLLSTSASRATARWIFSNAGGLRTLDPNPRRELIDDIKRYRQEFELLLPMCDVVKFSVDDARLVYPGAAVSDVASRFRGLGARLVVVTLGGEGAIAFTGRSTISVPSRRVRVVDTTGAGDAFMAAILARIRRASSVDDIDDLKTALDVASAFAALTCESVGGAESLPALESLAQRFPAEASVDWLQPSK